MENTWKLTKVEKNIIYIQEHLTAADLLFEMYILIGYAHHCCLQEFFTIKRKKEIIGYVFIYDFGGDIVKYIFEREDVET